jgi:DNA-binding HxlR family transcriptional regulator
MDRATRRRSFKREDACMIRAGGREYCVDPADGVLSALGKSWALPLIGVLGNRAASRFNELQDAVRGIGSKVLAERLRELQGLGLIERAIFAEVPARVEYKLTESGAQLRQSLVPLLAWAAVRKLPVRASRQRSPMPRS